MVNCHISIGDVRVEISIHAYPPGILGIPSIISVNIYGAAIKRFSLFIRFSNQAFLMFGPIQFLQNKYTIPHHMRQSE